MARAWNSIKFRVGALTGLGLGLRLKLHLSYV
jgi:hypothetical protein